MYQGKTVGVVVPAYNEEGLIGTVIKTMPEYVDRVYVIDDCSTDDTWDEIRRYAREANTRTQRPEIKSDGGVGFDDRVVPIQHQVNRGVGGAIKTGYRRALEDGLDVTAVMGGDGQMDPDILDRIIQPVVDNEADYSKGNRLLYPEFREGMSRWRFFGNSILTFLTKVASGYWKMMDPQNGYTAISNDALSAVEIEEMYEYYGYCNDLLVKLNANNMRVADVVMPAIYGDEESSINYRPYITRVSRMLLQNFFWRLKTKYLIFDFHPLALFYIGGIVLSVLGVLGGAWSLYEKLAHGHSLFVPASMSLLILTSGSLFLLFGMLFDMRTNESYETQYYE
jgi:glycosyltransferase involved in cell wall biosynthesis